MGAMKPSCTTVTKDKSSELQDQNRFILHRRCLCYVNVRVGVLQTEKGSHILSRKYV